MLLKAIKTWCIFLLPPKKFLTKELFKQGVYENSKAVHIIDQFSWCNSDMIVNKNVIVIIKTC